MGTSCNMLKKSEKNICYSLTKDQKGPVLNIFPKHHLLILFFFWNIPNFPTDSNRFLQIL